MIDSDFTVGFKQGQAHGKQIMQEKIDQLIDDIESLTWYSINQNGKLIEGSSERYVSLYKAEDIFAILDKYKSEEN